LLIEEVKVGCSLAMLQCLDRPHRVAFVLGEIMELSGPEAAEVLNIEPTLFRKRLQNAREAILQFTRSHCGLVSDAAACQCHQRVAAAAVASAAEAQPLSFAQRATSFQEARALVRQVEEARATLALYHSSEPRGSTIDFAQRLVRGMSPMPDSSSEPDR
jgi:hypothetical protein